MDGFIFSHVHVTEDQQTDTEIVESLRSERGFSIEHVVTGQGSVALF